VCQRLAQRLEFGLHGAAGGKQAGEASVEACARWAAEKASLT
jgi:hypothetical protein